LYKGFLRISKRYSEGNALENTPLNPLSRGDLENLLLGGGLGKPPQTNSPLERGLGKPPQTNSPLERGWGCVQ
jgi:hypothetical protein